MIAIDTNVLVYAHREDSQHHAQALTALESLAGGKAPWCVPWPCVHEFLAIVTHPRIYQPPSTMTAALEAVTDLQALGGVRLLSETVDHAQVLGALLTDSGAVGAKVHDARIAAICVAHGVSELWTADRDFSYFPDLNTRNPLVQR